MQGQDEKKPPVGGVVVDQWSVVRYADDTVMIQRLSPAGRVIEGYSRTTAARAALDLVAITQGCEPVREPLRHLQPIGPQGY